MLSHFLSTLNWCMQMLWESHSPFLFWGSQKNTVIHNVLIHLDPMIHLCKWNQASSNSRKHHLHKECLQGSEFKLGLPDYHELWYKACGFVMVVPLYLKKRDKTFECKTEQPLCADKKLEHTTTTFYIYNNRTRYGKTRAKMLSWMSSAKQGCQLAYATWLIRVR